MLLDAVLVAVCTLLFLQGFTAHVDVHPADELFFQQQGTRMVRGEGWRGCLAMAPVYSLAYGFLQLGPWSGVGAQDAMGVVVGVGSSLAMLYVLRAYLPGPGALLGAVWWASSLAVLGSGLRVYLFTAALLAVCIGLLARGRLSAAWCMAALVFVNRNEWLLVLVVVTLLAMRRRWSWRRCSATLLVLGALAAGVTRWEGFDGVRARAWFTFRWDYAVHFDTTDTVSQEIGVVRSRADAIVAAAFPDCRSLVDAIAVNPQAVVEHVGRNLAMVADSIGSLVWFPMFRAPAVRAGLLLIATALGGLGLFLLLRRRSLPMPAAAARPERLVALLLSLGALPMLVVFLPRPDYLLPSAPLWFVLGGLPIAVAAQRLVGWWPAKFMARSAAWRSPSAVAWFAVLAAAVALPGPFTCVPAALPPHREVLGLLKGSAGSLDGPLVATFGEGYAALAGLPQPGVDLTDYINDPRPLAEALPTPCTLFVSQLDLGLPGAPRLLAELETPRWRPVDFGLHGWLFARAP